MRKLLFSSIALLALVSPAVADEPTPAPPPVEPTPAPEPQPDKPADPPATPAPTPAPTPDQPVDKPGVNIPSVPTSGDGTSAGPKAFDDNSTSVSTHSDLPAKGSKPRIAVELSLTSAQLAEPFIQYKGWTLENGIAKGMRLEGNLGGILLAYELSSMSNSNACIANGDCLTGDFGSTTLHSVELGYRYRMSKIAMLRPFIAASLGGVLGNAGDWAMTSATMKGGVARGVFGVELPIANKVFGSASIGYRFVVVENPYHDKELDKINAAFVNAEKIPNGDYAEDMHSVSLYLGVGVSL